MEKFPMVEDVAYFFSSQCSCRTCPIRKFCEEGDPMSSCTSIWEEYILMDNDLLAIVMSDLVLHCAACPLLDQCDGDCFGTWKQWVDQMID